MLAAYLQNGEAVIMKHAVVKACEEIKKNNLPAKLISIIHDEVIFEVEGKTTQLIVKDIDEQAMKDAGEHLKFRVPIAGEGIIGRDWY